MDWVGTPDDPLGFKPSYEGWKREKVKTKL